MHFTKGQFQYNPDTKCYVAEASDLNLNGAMGVVCLDGYTFVYDSADYDASGEDIAGWRFKPTHATLTRWPEVAGHTMLIIND